MTNASKQRFQALLYYMLIILAVYITGCRNTSDMSEPETPAPTTAPNTSTNQQETCPVADALTAVVQSPTAVTLSWSWSISNYADLDNYIIQRKLVSASAWDDLGTVDVTGTPSESFDDNSAIPGDLHYRIVSDCNSTMHHSDASNSVTALAALPVPVITSVVYYFIDTHKVIWTYGGTPGANNHTGFQLEYVVSNGNTGNFNYATTATIAYPNLSNTVCPAGQTVTYRMRATRTNLLQSSSWSTPFQVNCP